jgi:hypothetical protein
MVLPGSGTPRYGAVPQAIQILDRFHAKEHLSKVGKVIYCDSKQGKKWIQRRYDELDQGRLKSLLKALDRQAIKYQEALECADYIRNNRNRMRYPEFQNKAYAPPLASWRPAAK